MSLTPGAPVRVRWSDGNEYDAHVVEHRGGHVLVGWPNGQQQWVEEQHVALAAAPAGPPGAVAGQAPLSEEVRERWNEIEQVIRQVESQQIPLGGVDVSRPETFWEKMFATSELERQGWPHDQAVQQQGFRDSDHMQLIMQYVEAKWSYLGQDEDGQPTVLTREEYNNSQAKAAMSSMGQQRDAAAAADPNLLAPVQGVSIELWARAAVTLGGLGEGATVEQVAQKLAELGLDKATYEAAQAGWIAKMQGDTNGVISMKYAEAFAAAQGSSLGGAGGEGEPCTFEHYCELGAAMDAWASQGLDVNAKLAEVFGIDALKFSKYATYWGMKMTTDMALLTRQSELHDKYKQKYVGAGFDDDLAF